jgi:hypothetical protein
MHTVVEVIRNEEMKVVSVPQLMADEIEVNLLEEVIYTKNRTEI